MEIVFWGESNSIIRGFPADVRRDFGGDLQRVQNGERPLDSGPMAPALPGVFELRADDKDLWVSSVLSRARWGDLRLTLLHQENRQDPSTRNRNWTKALERIETTTGKDEKALTSRSFGPK